MSKFDKVKKFYEDGYWSKEMVRNSVIKNWITPEQYTEITGDAY